MRSDRGQLGRLDYVGQPFKFFLIRRQLRLAGCRCLGLCFFSLLALLLLALCFLLVDLGLLCIQLGLSLGILGCLLLGGLALLLLLLLSQFALALLNLGLLCVQLFLLLLLFLALRLQLGGFLLGGLLVADGDA